MFLGPSSVDDGSGKAGSGVESLALGSPGRLFQTAGLHHHGQDTWMEDFLSSLWCWAEM